MRLLRRRGYPPPDEADAARYDDSDISVIERPRLARGGVSRGLFLLYRAFWRRGYADVVSCLVLLGLTIAGIWPQISGGVAIGLDSSTQFYPRYIYLGEHLRAGELPVWNPYQFAGTPFIGDPESGWMYLPAMILFTLLPMVLAAKGYVFFHLLFAGLGLYALARVLGMGYLGAVLAAISYEFSSYFFERNICCFTYTGVMLWLPLAILCAELAIRNRSWTMRLFWCALAGLAASQMLTIWLAQGAYYGYIALGGYMAYRTLVSPPPNVRDIQSGLVTLFATGAIVVVMSGALAAAALLPDLQFNLVSTLSGGYSGTQQAQVGGLGPSAWFYLLSRGVSGTFYMGGTVLALALVAPFVARKRSAVPYWALLAVCTLVLAGQGPTPLHWLLYHVLPGFSQLHPHDPERIMMLFYLATSLMAGATLNYLPARGSRLLWMPLLPAALLVGIVAAEALSQKAFIPAASLLFLILGLIFLEAYPRIQSFRRAAAVVMILLVALDLITAGQEVLAKGPGHEKTVDLAAYYAPTGAARFLEQKGRHELFRYYGYDPGLAVRDIQDPQQIVLYRYYFADPRAAALVVNNRATVQRVQSIQGYNPLQISGYASYINALNQQTQDYRSLYVLPLGVGSPLVDLLDVRYVIVPAKTPPNRPDLDTLNTIYKAVYSDGQVKVLENPNALPRAWIVHSARQASDDEQMYLVSMGLVDPGKTALLGSRVTGLTRPSDPAQDRAVVTEYRQVRIAIRTTTGAPGILMLSEVYYPAWHAYVDGHRAQVLRADGALRAVRIPAGTHTVEFRFESPALTAGLITSLLAYIALGAIVVLAAARRWRWTRPRAPHSRPGPGAEIA